MTLQLVNSDSDSYMTLQLVNNYSANSHMTLQLVTMTKHISFTEGYKHQDKTGTQNTSQTEKPKKHSGQRKSAGPGGWEVRCRGSSNLTTGPEQYSHVFVTRNRIYVTTAILVLRGFVSYALHRLIT